ncbi:hypothetical protein M0R45_028726 [Rubus argutus]|uniref:Uncharacterized protein n=1 Tax=Rubus argutus TaxID=59490 RepID=A0AAW1W655_RUBAR
MEEMEPSPFDLMSPCWHGQGQDVGCWWPRGAQSEQPAMQNGTDRFLGWFVAAVSGGPEDQPSSTGKSVGCWWPRGAQSEQPAMRNRTDRFWDRSLRL